MILIQPLVRLTTVHYQSAVSMISFAQVLTVQWSDTIPCQNVRFQVRITSHNILFQQWVWIGNLWQGVWRVCSIWWVLGGHASMLCWSSCIWHIQVSQRWLSCWQMGRQFCQAVDFTGCHSTCVFYHVWLLLMQLLPALWCTPFWWWLWMAWILPIFTASHLPWSILLCSVMPFCGCSQWWYLWLPISHLWFPQRHCNREEWVREYPERGVPGVLASVLGTHCL